MGIVVKPAEPITVEKLKEIFPKRKSTITNELVEYINEASNNPFFNGEEFINTLLTYRDVMEKQSTPLKTYITAIKFCAYLESEEYNITEAFKKSHSHVEFVRERWDSPTNSKEYKELTSAASRFRQRPLVKQILTQSQIGLHLMFQGEVYKAVGVLSEIMVHGRSEMARVAAAKELIANCKQPETTKIELDIGVRNNDPMESLNAQLAQFALKSLEGLKEGQIDLKSLGSMKVEDEEEVIDADTE